MSKLTQDQGLTNEQRKIIGLYCVELMQGEFSNDEHAADNIAKRIIDLQNEAGMLARKRYPKPAERLGKNVPHFLKCCVAAGIVDFADLQETTRWPGLQKKHCYRMPEPWFRKAYHVNTNISHGHLTDYIGRTQSSYLTTWTLARYQSISDDDYRRLIATVLLVSSQKNLSTSEMEKAINGYIAEPLPHYQNLPQEGKSTISLC